MPFIERYLLNPMWHQAQIIRMELSATDVRAVIYSKCCFLYKLIWLHFKRMVHKVDGPALPSSILRYIFSHLCPHQAIDRQLQNVVCSTLHSIIVHQRMLNECAYEASLLRAFEVVTYANFSMTDFTSFLPSLDHWADDHMRRNTQYRIWTIEPRVVC